MLLAWINAEVKSKKNNRKKKKKQEELDKAEKLSSFE